MTSTEKWSSQPARPAQVPQSHLGGAYAPAYAPAPRAVPSRRPRKHLWGLFWILLIAWLLLIAAVVAAASTLFQLYQSDLILPGVRVMDTDLGSWSKADAARMLGRDWQSRTIEVTAEGAGATASWTVTPDELGLLLDPEETVRLAHAAGRSAADLPEIREVTRRLLPLLPATMGLPLAIADPGGAAEPLEIAPVKRFDSMAAATTLRDFAQQLQIAPRDATLKITDGQVETTESSDGRAMDLAGTLAELDRDPWRAFDEGSLALTVVPTKAQITDLSSVLEGARRLLNGSVTVVVWDPVVDRRSSWVLTPDVFGAWLVPPENLTAEGADEWTVNEAKAAEWLQNQNAKLGDDRGVNVAKHTAAIVDGIMAGGSNLKLRIYRSDRRHTVKSGETVSSIAVDYGMPYPWIQQANPGLGDDIRVGQEIKIPSQDALLPLPPVENKRIVISIEQQRMQALENGLVKWDWQVSTGIDSSPTSPGIFQVQTHEPLAYAANWDLWMPQFMGIYQPVPTSDFMNGFHGFPTRGDKQLLWTNSLGHPVTYGCILLSNENAKKLYDWAEKGVIVEIRK